MRWFDKHPFWYVLTLCVPSWGLGVSQAVSALAMGWLGAHGCRP